jgi:hypothetical protein
MNTENNKLIADFMNLKVVNGLAFFKVEGENAVGEIQYHSDWNWLMSVVGKIEATKDEENNGNYYVEIYTSSCMIFSNGDYVNEIVSTSADTKIEAVYQAVVEFINNYNTQE